MDVLYSFFGLYALVGMLMCVLYAKPIGMIVGLGTQVIRYDAPDWMTEGQLRLIAGTVFFVLMIFTWPIQMERLEGLR